MDGQKISTDRQRAAFWISMVVALIMSMTFVGIIVGTQAIETGQKMLVYISLSGTILAAFASMWLSQRGKVLLGISLVFIGLITTVFTVVLAVSERGVIATLVMMVFIIVIATQTLSEKQANRYIIISSFFMIAAVLLDLWLPVSRVELTGSPLGLIVATAGALILTVVVAVRFRFLKLSSKLMIGFMVIPIVVVSAVGVFFVYQITNRLEVELQDRNLFDGERKIDDIQTYLSTPDSDVRFLGQSLAIKNHLMALDTGDSDVIAESLAALNEELRVFADTRQMYDQIRFIDASGQEVARVNRNVDNSISIVDTENLQNKLGRYYFDDTMELSAGELMISPLDLNVEQGEIEIPHKPMLRYGTPVELNGEIRGVVVTNLLAQNFLDLLADGELSTYLVDEDGYYLYHPVEAKRWGQDLGTGITINDDFSELGSLLTGEIGVLERELDLLTYQPLTIPGEDSPRWYLVNSVLSASALSTFSETLASGQAVLAVALLFVPVIAIFFSQAIASPIVLMTRSAEEIASGNFDVTLNVRTQDEIGALAQAFNGMTARLRTLVGSLETEVSQRTHGLELASEIGNRLAQITDRRELLETAVNLIGERFNLYYTQIYLLGSRGQTLRMRAGTGEVGRVLFAQAHYLPVGKGSINGMAAAERTAVVIENTENDETFLPNPLLPHTHAEMAIPLLVGTQLLGTLNMQADQLGVLTKENIVVFSVLASQLAIALQNAELFEQTNVAQMAIEAQAQRLTHDNWDLYLNAIDRDEQIAYSYDQFEAKEIKGSLADFGVDKNGLQTAVLVNNEGIGQLQIIGHQDREWTASEKEMLDLVAQQVGQRIENLRLLDETDRYRSEAEHALRRVTREGWDNYQQQNAQTLARGYRYDGTQVVTITEVGLEETAVSQSLIIGGQKIGSLSIETESEVDGETAVLLEQVATQLSRHIETLRLEDQTETALAKAQHRSQEMVRLNRIVSRISQTLDMKESLSIVAEEMVSALNIGQCSITLLDESREHLVIVAAYPNKEEFEGLILPLEGNLLTQKVLDTRSYVFVADAQNDPISSATRDIFREAGIRAVTIFPMIIGGEVIGTVGLDIYEAGVIFTEDQLRLAETIIGQTAVTVQNARLFDQTQTALAEAKQRSEEMATVNRVAQVASRQVDVEPLLQAIYTEVKGLMDVGTFHIMLYDAKSNMTEYPLMYEQGIRTYLKPELVNQDGYGHRVLQSGEPILENFSPEKVNRNRLNPDLFIGESENKETVSVMYAPLRTGQDVSGVLSIQSYQYDAYNETDLSLLVSIANYLAVALESARLFEQTRARARHERFLREISERVHTAVDAESVLRTAAREINRSLGLETVVYLDTKNENTLAAMSKTNGEQADG